MFYQTNIAVIILIESTHIIISYRQLERVGVFFLKPTTSIIEEGNNIKIPKIWAHVHTEVELGVIIGKPVTNPLNDYEQVRDHIAAYQLTLDLANMDFQSEERKLAHPWFIAKSFDTSTPVSRTVLIASERDAGWHENVDLQLTVNGKVVHSGNTCNLVFSIPQQICYLSKFMTLCTGDLILSGTPPGSVAISHGDCLVAKMCSGLDKSDKVEMEFRVD